MKIFFYIYYAEIFFNHFCSTHHWSSTPANDVGSRSEAVAVHHTGAGESERCQIESQEDEDVQQEHHHLEIWGGQVNLFIHIYI